MSLTKVQCGSCGAFIRVRDRIMSEYVTASGARVWVVSCLDGRHGTTVMLPEEY